MGEGAKIVKDSDVFVHRKKFLRERMVIQKDTRTVVCIATILFPDDCFKSEERLKELRVSYYKNGLLGIVRTVREDGNVSFKLEESSFLKLYDYYLQGFPAAEVIINYKPFFVREDEATAWVYDRMEEIFEWLRG